MSELSSHTISHLGRLARLALTEEEQIRFAHQLSPVVAYVEQLNTVDTQSVGILSGVTHLKNIYAEDVARTPDDPCSVDHRLLIAGAPLSEGDFILVRAVMGEEVVGA